VPVSVSCGLVRDKRGKIIGVLAVARDVSERKRAEEEIKRLNVDLQRRAAELSTANQELEAFAYSVSHDLRAPLRSIGGFSQAVLKRYASQLDAQGQNYLQRVCAASQRMAELIEDLLTLSRVTRAELRRGPVDLSALVAAVAAELRQGQPERQVEVVIADGLVTTGDARLLQAVLENLLGNAWKFTSKSDPARIEFGHTIVDGQPTYFVRDNGVGFDMGYADKLFGPFQRLHSADEFEGTGIGLATVQRIIRRHGGRVWAEGEVDQGATFYFTL
jgi:light-regulated signal transduction histidine kinase (bacteriophytochrome)